MIRISLCSCVTSGFIALLYIHPLYVSGTPLQQVVSELNSTHIDSVEMSLTIQLSIYIYMCVCVYS